MKKYLTFVQLNIRLYITNEVHKFKNLTNELSFLIRSLFFLLFGFLIDVKDVINTETLIWAIGIVIGILVIRYVFLKLFKITTKPLIFMAPRGLITILLFLSIPTQNMIGIANKSLIIQVIILSSVIMMIGLILTSKEKKLIIETSEEENTDENPQTEIDTEDKDEKESALHN